MINSKKLTKTFAFLIFLCLISLSIQQDCHYSCLNCTTPSYTTCFTCAQSTNQLQVLEDPMTTDPVYRHSLYKSGICTAKVPKGINILGVVLLVISIAGILITQSFQAFFICSTLQTLSLFGLLEIAWIQPSSFILQAFQYFMPINIILSSSKINDPYLFFYGFYRLDEYMISSQDTGLIAVFSIDCALFAAIVAIFLISLFRRKRSPQNQQQQNQDTKNDKLMQSDQNGNNLVPQFSNISEKGVSQKGQKQGLQMEKMNQQPKGQPQEQPSLFKRLFWNRILDCLVLRKVMHILIYAFFFFTQETALSIMVGAVFTISKLDIAIWIVYFIQIITVLVVSLYEHSVDKNLDVDKKQDPHSYGLSLFTSRQCMFIVMIKKVILPLGVVLPIKIQYMYFIFYLVLFLIEGTLDSRSGRFGCFSRTTLWKIFQMLITTLILSFFFNQKNGTHSSAASAIGIILTILLVVFMISLACELVFSFLGLLWNSKVNNQNQANEVKNQKMIKLNNTEQTINQFEEADQNVFMPMELARQETNLRKQQKIKKFKEVEIQDFQQEQGQKYIQKTNIKDKLNVMNSGPKINKQQFVDQEESGNKKTIKTQQSDNKKDSKDQELDNKKVNKNSEQKNFLQNQNQNKTIDTYDDQNQQNRQRQKKNSNLQEGEQPIEQQAKKKQKPKRKRIQDPQLRKRYGGR